MLRVSLPAALIAALTLPILAQETIGNAYDAKYKYEKALRKIAGVKDVSVGGVNGELSIIIVVDGDEAKEAVARLVGSRLDGHPIKFIQSGPRAETPEAAPAPPNVCANCTCPCHRRAGTTVAEPAKPKPKFDTSRSDDPKYAQEECDIMRQYLGLSERPAKNGIRCQQMIGWTNDPAKIEWVKKNGLPNWPSKELPGLNGSAGGFICYTYIKHRQFCPLGMKQILSDIQKLTPWK